MTIATSIEVGGITINLFMYLKRLNIGSLLIKHDVTAGVHFCAILLRIYIAAYGKINEETLTICNSPCVQRIPVN